jgi:hypothetical protein
VIIEEDYYLEHFGKKGMKWGVRKAKVKEEKKSFGERSGKQKAVILGAGGVAGLLAARFVSGKTMSLPATIIAGAGASTAGILITEKLLDKHGSRKLEKPKS